MNWMDLFIILILVLFALQGYFRDFFSEGLDLVSFASSFALSLLFYTVIGSLLEQYFHLSHVYSNLAGLMFIWFLVEAILFFTFKFVLRNPKVRKLNLTLNKFSVLPGFCRGFIFVSLIILIISSFPGQKELKSQLDSSRLGTFILKLVQRVETPFKAAFGNSNSTFSFLTVKPHSSETINLGFTVTDALPRVDLENKMIELVNSERSKKSLPALSFETVLRDVARGHSQDMFARGYFAHLSPEGKNVANRVEGLKLTLSVVGENLAYAPTLELAHQGLMNSPSHKENILSEDYRKIGIAVLESKEHGLMITQVFSD